MNFTEEYKLFVSKQIKNISETDAIADFQQLQDIGNSASNYSSRCRVGNNAVDFFTFCERLETRGKYDVTFYEFLENIEEFKKKKFITNMLKYYEDVKNKNKTKNEFIVYKEVYNICVSAINIFRPLMAMEIYTTYKPNHVIDPCAGWGGRLVGAMALNVPKYTGIEINTNLQKPYNDMIATFKGNDLGVKTNAVMKFESCLETDFSLLKPYDMVFTSPPYFFLEKYPNNVEYKSKDDMRESFYEVLIERSWTHLEKGGHFVLNVNHEIYELCCVPKLGIAHTIIPLKKSKRQNEYSESIYIWTKSV